MQRMKREAAIRRVGLVFIILTMLVQFFAVIAPPQASLQASPGNDLIPGGFQSQSQAVSYCSNPSLDYGAIMRYYGITCDDIAGASTVNIQGDSYYGNLFSMGRIAYGKAGETPVNIPSANNGNALYLRYLKSWGPSAQYKALQGKTKYGQYFLILFGCGNLVFVGLPTPQAPCPYRPFIYAADANCFIPCPVQGKDDIPKTSPQCFNPCPIAGKSQYPANSPQCFSPCKVAGKTDLPADSPQCFPPCQYNKSIASDSPSCKPCEQSQTKDDKTSCLELSKKASNITTSTPDANGTTVKASDVIEYTLTVTNKGSAKISKYQVHENVSDVLDYSDLVDLNGGKYDENTREISWPAQDLAAKGTVSKSFTVRIKNPIPTTPTSTSDAGHFDSKMTNVYGNTVTINLPQDTPKRIEVVTTTLPNTGPGTSLMIGFGIVAIIGYFFARSKLFATELDIVRHEFASTGAI